MDTYNCKEMSMLPNRKTASPLSFSTSLEQPDTTLATPCTYAYPRIVHNFRLIWLDPNINESRDDCRHSITQLRRVVNVINIFNDIDEAIDFVTEIKYEKAFLIVSGVLCQDIVPLIHNIFQFHAIYILSEEKLIQEKWEQGWPKVKGVFTQLTRICDLLEQDARDCDRNSISISVIAPNTVLDQNLDELEQSFMYTQILKEVLLEIEYSQQSIESFTAYCRDGNYGNVNIIEKFEREYHCQSPIWWYTYDGFIYSTLNRALRTLEVETILKMAFFVRDLHQQIEQLHSKQLRDPTLQTCTVYRGQGMSHADFEKIKKSQGGLLSFNNFLSTSRDRDVSFVFADSNRSNPDFTGILFQITVDTTVSSAPFALIDEVSCFKEFEQEVLFSMHTVFRIGEIIQLDHDNRFWQIELILTSDIDPQLNALTERLRLEAQGYNEWYRLGRILALLDEHDKAERLFMTLLHQESMDLKKMLVYNQLGLIKDKQGEYSHAIVFSEKSLEIGQRILPQNHPFLIDFLCNCGSAYSKMANYSKAVVFFEKALEIGEKTLLPNHGTLAYPYAQLASLNQRMGQYSTALFYYKKALEIGEKTLPQIHPWISDIYDSMGSLYKELGEYKKALPYFRKSLEIAEKIASPNSHTLAIRYNNIGLLHEAISEYSDALSFYQKGLEIFQRTVSSNHPELATIYNSMGLLYSKIGELSKALLYYEKSLEIRQKILPPDNLDLAISYNNIGVVYDKMGKNREALSYHQKSLEIRQKILPPDHPDLAMSYNNIGMAYSDIKKYSEALSYLEEGLKIKQRTLPQNHPSLVTSFNNIGLIYSRMNEYATALSYYQKSLEICQKVLPLNHEQFATSYSNIATLYRKMGEYSKALSFGLQALEIDKKNLSLNDPRLAHSYAGIGTLYYFMKNYSRALSFMQRAVQLGQNSLPPNDDDVYSWRQLMTLIRNQDSFDSGAMDCLMLLGSARNDRSDDESKNDS